MANVSSQSNAFSTCLIDVSFDMDEALTLPPNFGRQVSESHSLVADMPTVISDDVCSVCMEGFQSGVGGKRVPCGHVYHAGCISSWLSNYNSCPLCRSNIAGGKWVEIFSLIYVFSLIGKINFFIFEPFGHYRWYVRSAFLFY